MPIQSVIDTQRGIVLTTGHGPLTGRELIEHEQALRQEPDFTPKMNQLADFREARAEEIGWKDIRHLAFNTSFAPSARRAVVVATDAGYGLARMFQMAADRDDENMQVFRNIAEARRWLGLQDPDSAGAPGAAGHPPYRAQLRL
jgi:hypothetical protein